MKGKLNRPGDRQAAIDYYKGYRLNPLAVACRHCERLQGEPCRGLFKTYTIGIHFVRRHDRRRAAKLPVYRRSR